MKIPILMYHSVELMPKSTVMRSLHVPKSRFALQMKMLNILGYQGLSMSQLTPYLEGKKKGKVELPKIGALTFRKWREISGEIRSCTCCVKCKHNENADLNAAKNILTRGTRASALRVA